MGYSIETKCIHGENSIENNNSYGAVSVPIYQTATFFHPGIGETTGHNYTRESNPTRDALEKIISSLEGAIDTVACSSGMAAIRLCLELFERESHIICTNDLYGGSVKMFEKVGYNQGLEFSYTDTSDINNINKQIKENTKAIYLETPSNPTMKVSNLKEIVNLAKKKKLLVIVDNTFLTPYFQRPLELGVDIEIHSGTKYLAGHNDTLAGFLSTNKPEIAEKIRFLFKTTGCCLSPFDSFLVMRGIKTLSVRVERQQENAIKIAKWLKQNNKVIDVYYIGLEEHPGYEINKQQSSGFGSMISFRVDKEETARKILERVKLIKFAESLGGVETLITYPMLQTHGDVPKEVREQLGIDEQFLRMSVGIEKVDDLINDLKQAIE